MNGQQLTKRLGMTPVGRALLPLGWSIYLTLTRRPCWVRCTEYGWEHHFIGGRFLAPTAGGLTLRQQEKITRDIYLWSFELEPGANIVDIGAGIGTEIGLFSKIAGSAGKVLAIEAHPSTYKFLTENILVNNWGNVVPLQCAITNFNGKVLISDDLDNHINNSLFTQNSNRIGVPAHTLNSVVEAQGIETIDLLKLNIEGAEVQALACAERTLRSTRQIYVSCHDFKAEWSGDHSLRTRDKVIEILYDNGFQLAFRREDPRPWVRDAVYGTRHFG